MRRRLPLPHFDLSSFDKLEQYALAVGHAHALYRSAVAPSGGMAALAAELTVLRDCMYQAALTPAEFGLCHERQIRAISGRTMRRGGLSASEQLRTAILFLVSYPWMGCSDAQEPTPNCSSMSPENCPESPGCQVGLRAGRLRAR